MNPLGVKQDLRIKEAIQSLSPKRVDAQTDSRRKRKHLNKYIALPKKFIKKFDMPLENHNSETKGNQQEQESIR